MGPWDAFLRNARLRVIAFLPSDASLRDAGFRNWLERRNANDGMLSSCGSYVETGNWVSRPASNFRILSHERKSRISVECVVKLTRDIVHVYGISFVIGRDGLRSFFLEMPWADQISLGGSVVCATVASDFASRAGVVHGVVPWVCWCFLF